MSLQQKPKLRRQLSPNHLLVCLALCWLLKIDISLYSSSQQSTAVYLALFAESAFFLWTAQVNRWFQGSWPHKGAKNLWNSSKYTKYFQTFLQSRSRNWRKFSNQDAGWSPIRIMKKFVFAMQCVLIILGKGKSSLTWSRSAFSPWGTATTRTVLGLERNKKCQEGREKLPTLMTQDLQRNATNWRQPAVRVFGENLP